MNSRFTYRNYYYSFFIQDDWRVKPNLTLNLGMRWEHATPTQERFNRQTIGFDPNAINNVTEAARAAYAKSTNQPIPPSQFQPTGGLTYGADSRPAGYTTPSSFNPRFGISWAPSVFHNKTVFRAGLGTFQYVYGMLFGSSTSTSGVTLGYSQSTPVVATSNSYLTPAATLSDPFPGGAFLKPSGSSLGVNAGLGQAISYLWGDLPNQYSLRWNFDIQHQLAKDAMVELSYVGNHSVHQTNNLNLSAVPAQYLSRLPVRDDATIKALSAVVPNPFAGLLPGTSLNGTTTATSNLLKAFPEFSGVALNNVPNGGSYYYMVAARVQKRFSYGLQLSVNYTHSKLMQNIMLNQSDPTMVHSLASSDFPNRWVISGGYDLPFGRGRRFFGTAGRATDLLLGGWNLNGIYTWQSGGLVSWGDVIYYGGDLQWDPRNIQRGFDTSRFNMISTQQVDAAIHFRTFPMYFNNVRQDGLNNLDLSLIKNFHVTEKLSLQYRFEAFNSLNHVLFDKPNVSPTSKAFGTITAQSNTPRTLQMALRLKF